MLAGTFQQVIQVEVSFQQGKVEFDQLLQQELAAKLGERQPRSAD